MVMLAAAIFAKPVCFFFLRRNLVGHWDHSISVTKNLPNEFRALNVSKKSHRRKYFDDW